MNSPEPARKIDVLLNRLKPLVDQAEDYRLDELELQRLRREAQSLLKTDPCEAHIALGLIAMLRWDKDDACREFEVARALGWTPRWALNYAATLAHFRQMEDALHHAMTVVEQGPGSPFYLSALQEAAEWAYAVGRFHLGADLLSALQQHTTTLSPDLLDLVDTFNRFVPVADELGLTDDQMAALQSPAWRLIRDEGIRGPITLRDGIRNDGDVFISRTFVLPVTSEAILPLYEKLVAAQVEQEDALPIWDFSIGLCEQDA